MGNAAGTGNGTEKPSVVINIDDVGMCHGANVAYLALRRSGAVDSGSVMVPCPWFLEIAEIGAADPTLNLGVHITLTSEKRYYRWRPLTRASRASGLTDDQGFMWRRVPELRRNAHPDAVEEEMRAQIDAFLAAGMKPTHIDGHMGGVFSPEFVDRYVKLGLEYGIPTLYPATIGAYGPIHNLGPVDEEVYAGPGERLAAAGNTLAGNVLETPWRAVFTGDVLLIRGSGRTDFQNGDAGESWDSVTGKLFSLDGGTVVYPGHDYKGWSCSTIDEERRCNPRFAGRTRADYIALMGALNLPRPELMDVAVPANLGCGLTAG